MQSQVPNSNKYTIGKYLRNKKRLYKPDETATLKEPSDTLKEYMTYLTEKGMTVHKMSFADFKLKNGLSYSGVVASEKILTNETVLKIPKDLILNTRKAFFSELKPIFLENAKFFSAYLTSAWEDHILLVYLVNEYGKGPASEWYHMIKNLPREIDYVIFWDEEELELLEDPSLYKMAKQHRKIYDEEEAFVLELAKKYPDLLNQDVFTPENIRWIYIHLVTRCFGKFLEYTTMVPIAEFLNHECVDVLYDLEYSINNPNTPANYSMPDAKELSKEELEGYDTSDGSNKSEDEEFDSDFEYEQDETITPEETKNQIAKKLSGLELDDEIRIINDRIENMLVSDFDWGDGFSIFYVRGICKETAKVVERYKSKEIQLEAARNLMQSLETDLKIFKASAQLFYEKTMRIGETEVVPKQKLSFIKMIEEAEEKQREIMYASKPSEELFDKEDEWREDTFDNFIMKASKKDQFDIGSQLFFCYGRLSNRCALLRYGISLEYNKYEHVHLKVPYLQYINDTAWLMDKIKSFRVSRYMRFKLRRTTMNMNLINFCKGLFFELDYGNCETLIRPNSLDLEIQGIHKAIEILEEFLQLFSSSPEENKDLLLDPEVGYHEYFATVYRLERQRVVTFHLRALQVLEEIVKRLRKGLSLEFAVMRVHDLETNEECNRNRIFFAKYLEILKEHWKDRDLKKPKSKKKNI